MEVYKSKIKLSNASNSMNSGEVWYYKDYDYLCYYQKSKQKLENEWKEC